MNEAKFLAKVLEDVNRIRTSRGYEPLTELRPGEIAAKTQCVIANSLKAHPRQEVSTGHGASKIAGTYPYSYIDPVLGIYRHTWRMRWFIRLFDRGHFPELDESLRPSRRVPASKEQVERFMEAVRLAAATGSVDAYVDSLMETPEPPPTPPEPIPAPPTPEPEPEPVQPINVLVSA